MSIEAIKAAFNAPLKTSSQRLVLLAFAEHTNKANEAYPAIKTLVRLTCLNRKTVIKTIADLIELGHLTDTKRTKGQGVKVYQVGVPKTAPVPEPAPVPNLPTTRPNIGDNQSQIYQLPVPKTGHRTNKEPLGTNKEPFNKGKSQQKISFEHLPLGVNETDAQAFIDHRKALKAPLTQHAFNLSMKQAAQAARIGLSPEQAINETILAGWKGINLDWLQKRAGSTDTNWHDNLGM